METKLKVTAFGKDILGSFSGYRQYLREYENFITWAAALSAIGAVIYQGNTDVLKLVAAFGMSLTYCQFIFIIGRLPRLVNK